MGSFGVGGSRQGGVKLECPCLQAGSAVFPAQPSLVRREPGGQASALREAALPVSLSSAGLPHRWLPHRAQLCRGIAARGPVSGYLLSRPVQNENDGRTRHQPMARLGLGWGPGP